MQSVLQLRGRECPPNLPTSLRKVGPAFKMYGNDGCIRQGAGGFYGFTGGHGEMERSNFRHPRGTQVKQPGPDRESLRHLGHAFVPNGFQTIAV